MKNNLRGLRSKSGQSMTEFVIITPVMLLVVMGALQFAFIYNAKTTVNYATFQAARSGAVNHGKKVNIERAFARNMSALYTNDDNINSLQTARKKVDDEIANNYVCIERINPSPDAFIDHALPSGEIPNDNLMFRNPAVGLTSGLTIQDANLLKIRVTYCFDMIVPLVNRTIAAMATKKKDGANIYGFVGESTNIKFATTGSFQDHCYENNRIPIVSQAIVRMQSPAVLDASFPASCN